MSMKAKKFKLLGGTHSEPTAEVVGKHGRVRRIRYKKGQTVVSCRQLDKLFKNKFRQIHEDEDLGVEAKVKADAKSAASRDELRDQRKADAELRTGKAGLARQAKKDAAKKAKEAKKPGAAEVDAGDLDETPGEAPWAKDEFGAKDKDNEEEGAVETLDSEGLVAIPINKEETEWNVVNTETGDQINEDALTKDEALTMTAGNIKDAEPEKEKKPATRKRTKASKKKK